MVSNTLTVTNAPQTTPEKKFHHAEGNILILLE